MPSSLYQAIAESWILPLWPTLGVIVAGVLYLRGWRKARLTRPAELTRWRAVCFFAGLFSFWIALASPLDALNEFLLVAHMTQHLLLMTVAPPLLLLGNPVVPILRGLPRSFVRDEVAPWMNSRAFHWLQNLFTNPVFGWVSMDVAVVLWHLPAAYELALRSNFWHEAEHALFFFTSLSFWWYVIRPWPNNIKASRWLIVPYLAFSHMILFFVGLLIGINSTVIYPTYANVPRLFGITALEDQAAAGGEMMFVGLLVVAASLFLVMLQLLADEPRPTIGNVVVPALRCFAAPARLDFLRTGLATPAFWTRVGRPALRTFSVVAISAVIFDGLFGVQVAPMNLAGAAVWNVIRPLNLILLLFVANVFCMGCPFTVPGELVRRLRIPQLRWPERLSSKWLAAGLMLIFFWAYEQFALWNSPRATALLLVGYVVAASVINSVFRGASFCKYVCPVGQFNFIASLLSPLELGVRSQHECSGCVTHDCVRGNATQRGCELKLYLPNKVGNMDCTLCLDCVKACPEDNVAVTIQSPLRDLTRDPARSSLGRISARPDLAAVVLVVVFSSIASAAVMIAPVARVLDDFRQQHPWAANPLLSLFATFVFAAALLGLYIAATRLLKSFAECQTLRTVFCRFSLALLPLGLSVWLGHLAFHLASSWSAMPALFRHAAVMTHSMNMASSSSAFNVLAGSNGLNLFDLQVWIVNLGLFASWYAGHSLIRQMTDSSRRVWSMTAVWAASSTAMYAIAVWIFTQPMYMRGMGM